MELGVSFQTKQGNPQARVHDFCRWDRCSAPSARIWYTEHKQNQQWTLKANSTFIILLIHHQVQWREWLQAMINAEAHYCSLPTHLFMKAVSAFEHAGVFWIHVFMTDDAGVLHVQLQSTCSQVKLLTDTPNIYCTWSAAEKGRASKAMSFDAVNASLHQH